MKRLFAVIGITVIGICLNVLPAFSEEVSLKEKGDGKWLLYNEKGDTIGSITKKKDEGFSLQNAAGQFGGNIWSNGNWTPPGAWRGRRVVVTPWEAQLYVDALAALKANKML